MKASHILIAFVTNLCRGVLCAAKKWEMDSRHEYMPLIYQPPLPLSIYSSEILLLSSPPSYRNTMLAPHKQLYQNIGPFQAKASFRQKILPQVLTIYKEKHNLQASVNTLNKKANFGKYSKNFLVFLCCRIIMIGQWEGSKKFCWPIREQRSDFVHFIIIVSDRQS